MREEFKLNNEDEEFKLKIRSKNKSSEIQRILFKLGFSWYSKEKKIQLTDKRGLFFDLSDMTIAYTDDIEYFNDYECEKITLNKIKSKAFQDKIIKILILKNLEKT